MIHKLTLILSTLTPWSALALAIMAFIAPIQPMIFGVLFLIFADVVTGIMASYKRNKIKFKVFSWESWKHITSKRLGDTINKSLVYLLVILCAFIVGTHIMQIEGLYVTKFFAGAIALREIKSLVENGEIILGGGFISVLKSVVKNGFKGGLDEIFDKDKHDKTPE